MCHSACHVKSSLFNAHCKHRSLKKERKKSVISSSILPATTFVFFLFFLSPERKLEIDAVGVWTCCLGLQQDVEAALCFPCQKKKKWEVYASVQLCVLHKKKQQLAAVCCALYHTEASRQEEVFTPPSVPLIDFSLNGCRVSVSKSQCSPVIRLPEPLVVHHDKPKGGGVTFPCMTTWWDRIAHGRA